MKMSLRRIVAAFAFGYAFVPGAFAATYDGSISVNAAGKLVNGANEPIQLRGLNMAGLDDTDVGAVEGAWGGKPPDDWATQGMPDWWYFTTWKPNAVRIPLNAQSFLGVIVNSTTGAQGSPTWGTKIGNADVLGTYRQSLADAIAAARYYNCYIILDLHETRPKLTLGGSSYFLNSFALQDAFMDIDTAQPFWTSSVSGIVPFLAWHFGSPAYNAAHGYNGGKAGPQYNSAHGGATGFQDILFELFNEPTINTDAGSHLSTGTDYASCMKNGCFDDRVQNFSQGDGATNYYIASTWRVYGYQEALDGIRALGATNVIIANGPQYANSLQNYQNWSPVDTLSPSQVALGWHPYPVGTYPDNIYPGTMDPNGTFSYSGTAQAMTFAEQAIGAGVPLIITEDGDSVNGTDATSGSPHTSFMTAWADTWGASYLQWVFNGPRPYKTKSIAWYATVYDWNSKGIVPIAGEGVTLHAWMTTHP